MPLLLAPLAHRRRARALLPALLGAQSQHDAAAVGDAMKGATLFSGGGGVEARLKSRINFVHAVEFDPQIAAVYARNIGPHITVADVRSVDYAAWGKLDYLHASPVCKNASQAKANGEESDTDIETALAVVRCLEATRPEVFTLENVWGYRTFDAFRRICQALDRGGYMWHFEHLNAADFGGLVPCPIHTASFVEGYSPKGTAQDIVKAAAMMRPADQAQILAYDAAAHLVRATRRDTVANAICQLWANAVKKARQIQGGEVAELLMNEAISKFVLMGDTDENIELLLNECSEDPSWRARWYTTSTEIRQITIRLICKCFLAMVNTCPITMPNDAKVNDCPLCKITAVPQTRRRLILRATRGLLPTLPPAVPWVGWYAAIEDLIPGLPESKFADWQLARLPGEIGGHTFFNQNESDDGRGGTYGVTSRSLIEPATTIKSSVGASWYKAFIVSNAATMDTRAAAEPMVTVTATTHGKAAMPRAWLLSNNRQEYSDGLREASDPSHAITLQSGGRYRALVVHANDMRSMPTRADDEPAFTIGAAGHNSHFPDTKPKAWLATGRVVKMTPRALARFQSLPDWYALPDKASLACTIIGNMVPSLMMQTIVEQLCTS